jgi:hypothetical protein
MKKLITIIICLGTLTFTGQAGAAIFTYDFSTMGFSNGQNVEGLSLNSAVITSQTSNMWYTTSYGGGLMANKINGVDAATADLYIDFSTPINQIAATGGDGAGDNDAFSLYLYEFGTNNFIGRWDTPVFGGINEPEWYTLSVSASDVGRVLFDPGNSGSLPGNINLSGGLVLTDLFYNVIPEPATICLLGLGALSLLRRKR